MLLNKWCLLSAVYSLPYIQIAVTAASLYIGSTSVWGCLPAGETSAVGGGDGAPHVLPSTPVHRQHTVHGRAVPVEVA